MILVVCCKVFRAKLVSPPQMILGSYTHDSCEDLFFIDRHRVLKKKEFTLLLKILNGFVLSTLLLIVFY